MRTYSTKQAAHLAGIHWVTVPLAAWREGSPAIVIPLDGRTLWRWTDRDVEKIRKYKTAFYRKGRGRKKA